jgi:hypothetical protein
VEAVELELPPQAARLTVMLRASARESSFFDLMVHLPFC